MLVVVMLLGHHDLLGVLWDKRLLLTGLLSTHQRQISVDILIVGLLIWECVAEGLTTFICTCCTFTHGDIGRCHNTWGNIAALSSVHRGCQWRLRRSHRCGSTTHDRWGNANASVRGTSLKRVASRVACSSSSKLLYRRERRLECRAAHSTTDWYWSRWLVSKLALRCWWKETATKSRLFIELLVEPSDHLGVALEILLCFLQLLLKVCCLCV